MQFSWCAQCQAILGLLAEDACVPEPATASAADPLSLGPMLEGCAWVLSLALHRLAFYKKIVNVQFKFHAPRCAKYSFLGSSVKSPESYVHKLGNTPKYV